MVVIFFSCKKCNAFYWDTQKLKEHIAAHPKRPKQTNLSSLCDVCGKTFPHESFLRAHHLSHMPVELRPTFECYLCSKRFVSRLGCAYHMRLHTAFDKQFKCNICNQKYTRKDSLKRHLQVHTDNFPFSCQYCSKKFRYKNKLQVS